MGVGDHGPAGDVVENEVIELELILDPLVAVQIVHGLWEGKGGAKKANRAL
jgi:hypothetical protein